MTSRRTGGVAPAKPVRNVDADPSRRPRLRDVAALAGTSTAVVSYVLNDGPRPVAAVTRAKVLEAIRQLDYRPNSVARGLRAQRTGSLGLVVPDLAKPTFAKIASAVEDAALLSDQRLLIVSSRFDLKREHTQTQTLIDARVDGLILVPAGNPATTVKLVRDWRLPFVIAHRNMTGPTWSVSGDDSRAGRDAARHLLRLGHTTVVCLSGPVAGSPVDRRTNAFVRTLQTDTAAKPAIVIKCDYAEPARSAYQALSAILATNPDVTAVCVAIEEYAPGVLRAAAEAGRTVGSGLDLIVVGGTHDPELVTPRLTSFDLPFADLGTACIDLLVRQSEPEQVAEHQKLPLLLREGDSCGGR